jgi:hypothetical protein
MRTRSKKSAPVCLCPSKVPHAFVRLHEQPHVAKNAHLTAGLVLSLTVKLLTEPSHEVKVGADTVANHIIPHEAFAGRTHLRFGPRWWRRRGGFSRLRLSDSAERSDYAIDIYLGWCLSGDVPVVTGRPREHCLTALPT